MISLIYAKVLSLYLIIFSLALLVNAQTIRSYIAEINTNRMFIILAGAFSLMMGSIIVVTHSIWHGWPIVITLIGYLSLCAGTFRLFCASWIVQHGPTLILGQKHIYYIVAGVALLLGLLLFYFGFIHGI